MQCTVHLFYPKVQPFDTPSLSPLLEGKKKKKKGSNPTTKLPQLSFLFFSNTMVQCYTLSFQTASHYSQIDKTKENAFVEVSGICLVPERKKSSPKSSKQKS